MSIVFTKSANGEATCSYNSIRLHSAYNPSREAERFVHSVSCDFNPKYILVTGAALSYCAIYFKKYFPLSILCAVQFSKDFSIAEKLWSKTFYTSDSDVPLSEQIYSFMGEEGIVSCFFTSWQPSEKAFPDENEYAWKQIKNAVVKSRNVLATRSFFAKRWVKNSMRFCLFARKTCGIRKGSAPVIICASGPSLESSLQYIKQYRNSFFLIAVSSAMYPLTANGIKPDLCVSTDGGYWAKHHLSHAFVGSSEIPVALSAESACYAKIMDSLTILPLDYGDGISETFLKKFSFESIKAYRNGTVSGTAVQLAMSLTTAPVFFCGLDLAPSKEYAHTQPNELEIFNMQSDNRLRPLETRIYPSSLNSPSLNIYRSWFASSDFMGRVYRLSAGYNYRNTLGKVQDVDWSFFDSHTKDSGVVMPKIFPTERSFNFKERFTQIKDTVASNINNKEWIREAVPADYIVYERSAGMESEAAASKKVQADMQTFYKDIMRSFILPKDE